MATNIKLLGQGSIGTATNPPGSLLFSNTTSKLVTSVVLLGTSSAGDVTLYAAPSGTATGFEPRCHKVNVGFTAAVALTDVITLGAGDELRGSASVANINYVVYGIDRD